MKYISKCLQCKKDHNTIYMHCPTCLDKAAKEMWPSGAKVLVDAIRRLRAEGYGA